MKGWLRTPTHTDYIFPILGSNKIARILWETTSVHHEPGNSGTVGQAGTCVYPSRRLYLHCPLIQPFFSLLDQFIFQPICCNVRSQKSLYSKATIATTITMSFVLQINSAPKFHDPEQLPSCVATYLWEMGRWKGSQRRKHFSTREISNVCEPWWSKALDLGSNTTWNILVWD